MLNTTPSCFLYPQKKLRHGAPICPRKAPTGSEQSQDLYPDLQLPLGPPSPAQAIRIQQGFKGHLSHDGPQLVLPGASSHLISTTPLGIEDSIHFTLFLPWGKLRMEEHKPCPKLHGVQIRSQNSNRVVWGSLHKPSPPPPAAPVPLQKPSFTLACAISSLPPRAFLPAFWGHAANAERSGEGGGRSRVEKGVAKETRKPQVPTHRPRQTPPPARPCGPAPRPATAGWPPPSSRPRWRCR